MQRDTARLAASGANETAGPAPLEQERRAPRLVRKRFLKLGKRTPPRHRSFIPAIPHGRLDHSHTICSSYLSQRDKPWLLNTPVRVVDLRTGDLQPHRRDLYMTKITAVVPSPGPCP